MASWATQSDKQGTLPLATLNLDLNAVRCCAHEILACLQECLGGPAAAAITSSHGVSGVMFQPSYHMEAHEGQADFSTMWPQ